MLYLSWALVTLGLIAFVAYGVFVQDSYWFLLLLFLSPRIKVK